MKNKETRMKKIILILDSLFVIYCVWFIIKRHGPLELLADDIFLYLSFIQLPLGVVFIVLTVKKCMMQTQKGDVLRGIVLTAVSISLLYWVSAAIQLFFFTGV